MSDEATPDHHHAADEAHTSAYDAQQPARAELPRLPELPQTGDQRVDEALEPLADVDSLPPGEQVEVYVGVHRALQDRLADLEG